MLADERLIRIQKELQELPEGRRFGYICWATSRAGVPLDGEPTFDELQNRIGQYDRTTANRILAALEEGLVIVKNMPVCQSGKNYLWTISHDSQKDEVLSSRDALGR